MKKTITMLLMCILISVLGSVSLAEETIQFMQLPDDVSNLPIDNQNPTLNPVTGAVVQTIEVGERSFSLYNYLPLKTVPSNKVIIIALDSQADPATFLAESGWLELAEENGIVLLMIANPDGWDVTGKDVEVLEAVYNASSQRQYYNLGWDMKNLIGYGDASIVARQFAMANPEKNAAVLTFGGQTVSQAYMEQMESLPTSEAGSSAAEVPTPIWLFVDEMDDALQDEITYWKRANNSGDEVFSSSTADYIYMPSYVFKQREADDWNIAQLRVTIGNTQGYGREFLQTIYDDFLNIYIRAEGIGNRDLRYVTAPKAYDMKAYSKEVNGLMRYWYVYAPQSVLESGEAVPLVVSMAGRGSTNETFPSSTGWPQLAEERGFIVAFPMGSYGKQLENGIQNVTMWNANFDDVAFIREMVAEIKSEYNIDAGRVYANGHSMGCMMALRLSVTAPDIFTAVGGACASLPSDALTSEYLNENVACPVWLVNGEMDTTIGVNKISENEGLSRTIEYYVNRYALTPLEEASCYRSGNFNHYVFYTPDHVPMFRFTVVEKKPHSIVPAESEMLYDEFFAKFYRDDQGVLHYEESEDVYDIR